MFQRSEKIPVSEEKSQREQASAGERVREGEGVTGQFSAVSLLKSTKGRSQLRSEWSELSLWLPDYHC